MPACIGIGNGAQRRREGIGQHEQGENDDENSLQKLGAHFWVACDASSSSNSSTPFRATLLSPPITVDSISS